MSTLLVHFVSDFLRDTLPAAGQFGEALRCAVLQDEKVAFQNYGLDSDQKQILMTKSRERILEALSNEVGAVMDEVDGKVAAAVALAYPSGSVEVREAKVLFNAGNSRTILVRGFGFNNPTVDVLPQAGGSAVAATILNKACDPDVWQRLYVSATLAPGSYTMRVTSGTKQGQTDFDVT